MPSCELCGRNMKGPGRNVTIEGADMLVCPQCAAKFGGHTRGSTSRRIPSAPKRPSWIGGPMKQHRIGPDYRDTGRSRCRSPGSSKRR